MARTRESFQPWKPVDNLLIIMNMLHTGNVKQTFMCSKFSKHYTLRQVKNQWRCLLHNQVVVDSALNAIQKLHMHKRHNVYQKLLLNSEEQELICSIKHFEEPTLQTFENLLHTHAHKFHWTRTAKFLMKTWQKYRQRQWLSQQKYALNQQVSMVTPVKYRYYHKKVERELKLERRVRLRHIRRLEQKIECQSCIDNFATDVFCTLKGKQVIFKVKCLESTIGRNTQFIQNDIDLSQEGECCKISRRQANLLITQQLEFLLINVGRIPILINGCVLPTNCQTRICNETMIAFDNLEFVFKINKALIYRMRKFCSINTHA